MIYVDNYRVKARVGKLCAVWSHLFAWPLDDEALIKFARKLGLKKQWIQNPGTLKAHFDVTEGMRVKALALGATFITARGYGELVNNEMHYRKHAGKENEPYRTNVVPPEVSR